MLFYSSQKGYRFFLRS